MHWIDSILLLGLGVLGASSVIVRKRPDAKELIDTLSKYSGWFGLAGVMWGVYGMIFRVILHLDYLSLGSYLLLAWLTTLLSSIAFLCLGIIFGYGMIMTYAAGKLTAEQKAKSDALRMAIISYQIPLGWFAIALALWEVVLYLVIANG